MWWVYIVRCADGSLYVGEPSDLDLRLLRHNEGRVSAFTAHRQPVVLAYSEQRPTREAALTRERQLKRWIRAKKEAVISEDLALLKRL